MPRALNASAILPQGPCARLLCLADDRKHVGRVPVRFRLHGIHGALAGHVKPEGYQGSPPEPRPFAYRVGNVRTLGAHSATPSGATPRPFWATTTTLRNKALRCVSSFKLADASTRGTMCCRASLGVTVAPPNCLSGQR